MINIKNTLIICLLPGYTYFTLISGKVTDTLASVSIFQISTFTIVLAGITRTFVYIYVIIRRIRNEIEPFLYPLQTILTIAL